MSKKQLILLILCLFLINACDNNDSRVLDGLKATLSMIPTNTVKLLESFTPSPTPLPSQKSYSPTVLAPTIASSNTAAPTLDNPPVDTAQPTVNLVVGEGMTHFTSGQKIDPHVVRMLTPTDGWMVASAKGGGDEHIFLTNDGGLHWMDRSPSQPLANNNLIALATFQSITRAWVIYTTNDPSSGIGEPFVWRTEDSGQNWEVSSALDVTGLDEYFQPGFLQFVDDQVGWLLVHVGAGMNHDYITIYRSSDGGVNWVRIQDPYNDLSGIQSCLKTGMQFIDTQEGWLTGDCQGVAAGVLLFSTSDGGMNWETVELPEPSQGKFSNMGSACGSDSPTFFDTMKGYIAVNCMDYSSDPPVKDSFIFKTLDGGISWTSSVFPGGKLLFIDLVTGWALSKDIYQTTDGTLTWNKLNSVNWEADFSFISANLGWAAAQLDEKYGLVITENSGRKWDLIDTVVK